MFVNCCCFSQLVYPLTWCAQCIPSWDITRRVVYDSTSWSSLTGEESSMSSTKIHLWFKTSITKLVLNFWTTVKFVGYIQSKADCSLFTKSQGKKFTAILIYIDDILLTGSDLHEIKLLKSYMLKHFLIKDLSELKYFMGIKFSCSKRGIFMSQRKICIGYFTRHKIIRCEARKISNGAKLETNKWRWRNTSWSKQVSETGWKINILDNYQTWHSIFSTYPKSIHEHTSKATLGSNVAGS